MFMLKMQLNFLLSHAKADSDVGLYADMIYDNMGPEQIRQFIMRPDLKEFLTAVNPEIAQYWPWFERLKNELVAILTEEETPTHTKEGEPSQPPGEDTGSDAVLQPEKTAAGNAATDT